MNNPKLENMLNMALSTEETRREASLNLNVGYNALERSWDLIVRYTGDLTELESRGIKIAPLLNRYAVLSVPESQIDFLTSFSQIIYVEKPKRLYFAVDQGRNASCISNVQNERFGLTGRGVLVACLDSGVDYAHPDFRNADGSSRILYLWDQTLPGIPPAGYFYGTEYTKSQLDEALVQSSREEQLKIVPATDAGGHGTAVLGIAAGNGRASGGRYRGVAYESPLLVVKLGVPKEDSFPRTTELMQAVDYCVRKAQALGLPLALNISFGNTYGAHDGTSLLETYLSDVTDIWKSVICVGMGNEGYGDGHTTGRLKTSEEQRVELAVAEYEPVLNVQLWKSYVDEIAVWLIHPNGQMAGPLQGSASTQRFLLGNTEILAYYGEPVPYSTNQELYLDFLPVGDYIDSGIWQLVLEAGNIVEGDVQLWLPSAAALNRGTRFLNPVSGQSLTIPASAKKIIAVAAYDSRNLSYADFSGRGTQTLTSPVFQPETQKPDLAAPGVNITAPVSGGSYGIFTGTSFATPFVTGSAALLMQWGITEGNDPFLYGEKIRAYLQRGARQLPGFEQWPNEQLGYGTLCVRDSLPE